MLPVRGAAAGGVTAGVRALRAGRRARALVLGAVPGARTGSPRSLAHASTLRRHPPLRARRVITDPLDHVHSSSESARLTVIVLR